MFVDLKLLDTSCPFFALTGVLPEAGIWTDTPRTWLGTRLKSGEILIEL
jgi:hypothetical protein